MRLTPEQIKAFFSEKIWYLANKYAQPFITAEEIHQELTVLVWQEDWPRKRTRSITPPIMMPIDPARVNQFLSGRVYDIVRKASRLSKRQRSLPPGLRFDSDFESDDLSHEIVRVLQENLTPGDFLIVMSKAFPSIPILNAAVRDHRDAQADRASGVLRMNVLDGVRVFDKHVAEVLGISPATMSRATAKARAVLAGRLEQLGLEGRLIASGGNR